MQPCQWKELNIYAKKVSCHRHSKNDFKRLVAKKKNLMEESNHAALTMEGANKQKL